MLVGSARTHKARVDGGPMKQNTHSHPDSDQGVHHQDEDKRFDFGTHICYIRASAKGPRKESRHALT